MFPGGMPDLTQIVLRAQQMQADMERAQASLAQSEVTGSAGGGLVTATVTGSGELTGLTLDPGVVDPQDTETLADLIIAAVRDANRRAQEMSSETMGAVTGGLAESFDLSSLGLGGLGGLGGFGQPAGGIDRELDEELDDELDDDTEDDDDTADTDDADGAVLDGELVVTDAEVLEVEPADDAAEPEVLEGQVIETGHPTDAGADPADPTPDEPGAADRAAPGRS